MGIGSHGAAHRTWRHLPPNELEEELAGSKRVLEEICGFPIDRAACPFGEYDRRVLQVLRSAGYRFVYTSDGGCAAASQWLRARTTVTRLMPLGEIERLIRHGPGAWKQASIGVRTFIKRLRP